MTFRPVEPVDGINATIGSTPLVCLNHLLTRDDVHVFAKLEGFNPTHSAKDRTAQALIEDALSSGALPSSFSDANRPALVESSSGNLGMALARECAVRGWDFHCVVDPRANEQTVATMRAFGATVHLVSQPDRETGDWLIARRARVDELLREIPGSINLGQYSNQAALSAHDTGTMTEVIESLGQAPDFLFVAMSTTGTIGGCARHLHRIQAQTTLVGVDAEGSVLFGGCRGTRTLPGFGAGMVPELAQFTQPDDITRISDADSIIGARILARREGILPGASGGAVVTALLKRENQLPSGSTVVLLLHDDGQAYMNTIYDSNWVHKTLGLTEEQVEQRLSSPPHKTTSSNNNDGEPSA